MVRRIPTEAAVAHLEVTDAVPLSTRSDPNLEQGALPVMQDERRTVTREPPHSRPSAEFPFRSHRIDLEHLVSVVVDDFHGNLPRIRTQERPARRAVERGPGSLVDVGAERSL